jgi:DNA-binding MarR family transcriptional regulator
MSTTNNPSTDLSRNLVQAFGAFGPAYMKWMTAGSRDRGVTYARMRVLHALKCHGPQIMSGLRDELGVTARSVTALIDALEEDQLVRRVPHPSDRRATIIQLTTRGQETLKGRFEAHAERAAELFERLDQDDQRHLLRILGKLRGALTELTTRESPA